MNKLKEFLDNYEDDDVISSEISTSRLKDIHRLLKDSDINRSLSLFEDNALKFDYSNLVNLEDNINFMQKELTKMREDIELEKLIKSGDVFNWEKLKRDFTKRGIFKKFPSFSWSNYKKLIKNPPLEILNYKGQIVKIDKFLARKLIIGINQMVGNGMDLWIMNTGSEGAGKSCFASQQLIFLYTFLKKAGLITYAYSLKKIIKGSLKDLLDSLTIQKDEDFFRLYLLDEAEDLDRMNFREDDNKQFKSTMRRSRKQLNIVILNTPQVGEIDTSVTLARINMIFYSHMDYDATTGLLKKGFSKLYIIPRTNVTYSPFHKKNLTQSKIKGVFSKQFEKKIDYYKTLPDEILIKDIRFYETWGFDEDEYDKLIRTENKVKNFEKGVSLTKDQMYCLFRYKPKLRDWYDNLKNENLAVGCRDYNVLRKFFKKIEMVFKNDSDLLKQLETIREYKGDEPNIYIKKSERIKQKSNNIKEDIRELRKQEVSKNEKKKT